MSAENSFAQSDLSGFDRWKCVLVGGEGARVLLRGADSRLLGVLDDAGDLSWPRSRAQADSEHH
jgi:hypothetical protein